mgnify:CR=1 FL=1
MSGIVGSKLNIRGSGLVGSLGTDGQHMLSSGAGKTNIFETVGGGAVLQVQSVEFTSTASNTSASPAVFTAFDIAFTPTASTSKLCLQLSMSCGANGERMAGYFYDSTGAAKIGPIADASGSHLRNTFSSTSIMAHTMEPLSFTAWFTPGDTTTRTIQVFAAATAANTLYINRTYSDTDDTTINFSRSASTFTITEYDGSIVTIA